MIAAFSKALAQMSDPAFRSVLLQSLLACLGLFVVVWVLAWLGLSWVDETLGAWIAGQQATGLWGWILEALQWLLGALALVGMVLASIILFPSFTMMFMGLLLEKVAGAVEARHYRDLAPARSQPVLEAIRVGVSFVVVSLFLNLLALPLYLIPGVNAFVFYLLNGYLLGREYFELVAQRRMEPAEMTALRRRGRLRWIMAGVVIAVLFTIPIVNLAVPILATAFMVHLFEGARRAKSA